MWIFWALLSAVLVASRRPFEKKIINKMHHFSYGFIIQCISLPILAAIVVLSGQLLNPLTLGLRFWVPIVIVSAGFYPLNAYLYKHALKDGELSKVLPLQSLWPVFTLLLAWIMLREIPSFIAVLGIVCTVLGIYALGLKGKRLHHPLQPFREDSSSRAMLAGVLLVSLVSILDKTAIQASNPLFYSFASTCGAVLTLFVALRISKQTVTANLRPLAKHLGIVGILQSTTYITYLLAVASGPVAYVSTLRSTNILMGSVLGILIFKERLTKPKLLSFLLIIIGALFLAFGAST